MKKNKVNMMFALITSASFLNISNPETDKVLKEPVDSLVNIKDLNKWDEQVKKDFGYVKNINKATVVKSQPSAYNQDSKYDSYRMNDFVSTSVLQLSSPKFNAVSEIKNVDKIFQVEEDDIKLLPSNYPQNSMSELDFNKK